MKRNFTLGLLVLTAIVCVVATGCGSRQDNPSNTTNGSTAQDTMNGSGSSNGSSNGGSSAQSGSSSQSGGNLLEDAGNAIGNGLENAGDAITGNGSSSGATSGVPYDQMLDNGKVTDHDGNLKNDAGSSTSMARNRSR